MLQKSTGNKKNVFIPDSYDPYPCNAYVDVYVQKIQVSDCLLITKKQQKKSQNLFHSLSMGSILGLSLKN